MIDRRRTPITVTLRLHGAHRKRLTDSAAHNNRSLDEEITAHIEYHLGGGTLETHQGTYKRDRKAPEAEFTPYYYPPSKRR